MSTPEWYSDKVREYQLIVMPDAKFVAMLTLAKLYLDIIGQQRLDYRPTINFVLIAPFIKSCEDGAMRTSERP